MALAVRSVSEPMQSAEAVYGVTMQEPGVSTIVGVRLAEPQAV